MDIFEKDYKEFCEMFAGLNVEQARAKADMLNMGYTYDPACNLIDIDYKSICGTIYEKGISDSYKCYNDDDVLVKTVG